VPGQGSDGLILQLCAQHAMVVGHLATNCNTLHRSPRRYNTLRGYISLGFCRSTSPARL
jgi:hypothetical protein